MKKLLIALLSMLMTASLAVVVTGCDFGGGGASTNSGTDSSTDSSMTSSSDILEVYTVTFDSNGGSAVAAQEVTEGEMATEPTAPTRPGYTFDGWKDGTRDWSFDSPVTGNMTLTAAWTINEYDIKFVVDGVETTQSVEHGALPAYEGTPTKEATAEWSYNFTGWTPAIVEATEDATYTAQFEATKRSYTIKFVVDGVESTQTLEYGAMPVEPTNPEKETTAEFTYTFAGWDKEITTVTGEETYTAQFDAVKRSYTITFIVDGAETSKSVEYGETPAYEGTPAKEATAEWTYNFTGWTPAIEAVTGEAVYTAQFEAVKRNYTITFIVDGAETTQSVGYGETPAYEGTPAKEATAEWSYNFTGWTPAIEVVTGEATYTAQFEAVKRSYTITFVVDGVESTQTLEFGANPVVPENPAKEATAEFTYTFAGWDKEITSVSGDATYTAKFDATKNSYTITFIVDGVESTQTLEYGAMPVAPENPAKEATAEWTYTFIGWDKEIAEVTGEETYTAQFEEAKRKYTVTFNSNGGSAVDSQEVEYGATITRPADPTWENNDEEFVGWFVNGEAWDFETTITGEVELTAEWKSSEVDDNWNDKEDLA